VGGDAAEEGITRISADAPINIVLADSELELVPERIAGHPAVRKNAEKRKKRPTHLLLDSSLHHQAMRVLPDWTRRGRPDIVHYFLLFSLDSILNQEGFLRVWIHTRNDELISVNPETKIPRAGHRFTGLMESLFHNRVVPDRENPLLAIESGWPLASVLEDLRRGGGRVVCLSPPPRGKVVGLDRFVRETFERAGIPGNGKGSQGGGSPVIFVVGGFPEGDYRSDVYSVADDVVSIYEGLLTVWTVTAEIIASAERALGLL